MDSTIGWLRWMLCFAYNYFDFDFAEAAHGRAGHGTGIKLAKKMFSPPGDGDASMGMGDIAAGCPREQITVFFINNTNYGMTGGQMAPTTLPVRNRSSLVAMLTGYPIGQPN